MSLYDRFENEAAFRDQFVKRLLNRLGYFGVSEEHGTREFGKDFVFSELHLALARSRRRDEGAV